MVLFLSVTSALLFAVGGVFMKLSHGMTHVGYALLVNLCFLLEATCQGRTLVSGDLGPTYLFVLGLESILAFLCGVFLFGETVTMTRLAGVAAVIVGLVLLHVE